MSCSFLLDALSCFNRLQPAKSRRLSRVQPDTSSSSSHSQLSNRSFSSAVSCAKKREVEQ